LKSGKLQKVREIEPKKAFASNDMFARVLTHFEYEVPMKISPTAAKKGLDEKIPALAVGDPEFVDMLNSEDSQLRDLCEARVAAKSALFETRSAKFAAVGATGPWPFDVVYSGAQQTHRLSGGSAGGGNPQNLPARNDLASVIRRAIVAPVGHKLVVGDFANIELRVLAWLSRDSALIDAITTGRDLYCDFGSMFYGRRITRADTAERHFSKIAVLGLGYGMGAAKFVKTVKIQADMEISQEEAERAVNLYRATYGAVPALWKYLGNLLPLMASGQSGRVYTMPAVQWEPDCFVLPSGLRIRYPALRVVGDFHGDSEWAYTAYRQRRKEPDTVKIYGGKITENLCQGLAGEICKDAIRLCGFSAVGQVHDELLVACPNDMVTETKMKLEKAMSTPPLWCPEMKLACEVGVGDNWLEAKS
jgi:DNA polymerase